MPHNKVVLITGAARRIGATTTRALHARGFRTIVHYRSSAREAQQLVDGLNKIRHASAATVQGDLCNEFDLQRIARESTETFGQIDALINNASSFYPTPLAECSEESFDDLIGCNLKAPIFLSKHLAPELSKTQGCIVNITDIYADRPLADHIIYCAAKAGLVSVTKSLARELAPKVRVNAVSPGAILWAEHDNDNDNESQNEILRRTPLNRLGDLDDIAASVVYLVCAAGFVSGQILVVDGGRTTVP